MEKSADAFRTISEVAEDLALPQHVLRFWETRFPQVRPLKRAGGRRYYRPADVLLLRVIRQLLYDDGYTIKGVQRLLKEQGAKELGAGLRPADAGRTTTVEALGDFEDESDDAPDAEDDGPAEGQDVPAMAALLSRGDARNLIEEALATVEECKRILDAVLRSPR